MERFSESRLTFELSRTLEHEFTKWIEMALMSNWSKSGNCPDSGPVSPTSRYIYHGTYSLFHIHSQIRGVRHIHSGPHRFESLNTKIHTFPPQYLKRSLSAALSLIKKYIRRWKLTLCTPWRHVRLGVYSFITLVLVRGECLAWWLGHLTYTMMQNPPWAANWLAASQEIPCISRNPKVHYRTHKRTPPISILGQPNPVHMPTSNLLEIHPNIIHPSTPRSPQWSLSLRFPHQDPMHSPLLTHTRHMPSPSHSSRFYHPHDIRRGVQII